MFSLAKIFTFSISILLIQVTVSSPILKSIKTSNNLIIRHVESGLVVDGKEHYVKLQKFTNSSSQIWNPVEVSLFVSVIYNKETDLALSVEGMFRNGSKVITERHTWAKQEWIISENNFISFLPDSTFNLYVEEHTNNKSYLGANLVISEIRNLVPSQFNLEYV